jgi:hypothetical protein
VEFAVNAADVATPEEFVVAVFTPPANVPEAPLVGAVNVTVTPLTAFPPGSFTVALSGLAKAVLTVALCGVPPVAVIEAGLPAWFVSAKLAAFDTPDTLAVTL